MSTTAGKATTDEELEEMLEGGNSAVFTAGVSLCERWSFSIKDILSFLLRYNFSFLDPIV